MRPVRPAWIGQSRFALALLIVALLFGSLPGAVSAAPTPYRDFPVQDYWIQQGIEALGTSPTRPNTAADYAVLNAFAAQQRANEAAALAYLGASLPSFNQELSFYQGVLASGGDPKVFFGQSPLPSFAPITFRDPFFSGPAWLSSAPPAYVPPFLRSIRAWQINPVVVLPVINFIPVSPAGNCTIGNVFQPTTITFNHNASRPLLIYLTDSRCREILYSVLLPRTSFVSLTFVGQTWRFRDGFTGQYVLGESQFVIPNTNPQFYTVFDVFSALTAEASSTLGPAQAATQTPAVVERFAAIRERQGGQVYSNAELQALRIEAGRYMLERQYADPLLLYLEHEIETLQAAARAASPSFAEAQQLAAEIASWTELPADPATLRERYAKRLQLQRLEAWVDDDVVSYWQREVELSARLSELEQRLAARMAAIEDAPETLLWQAEWQQRWDRAYYTSEQGIAETQEILDLRNRNAAFASYWQLNNEVAALLPSVAETAPAQRLAELRQRSDNDSEVRARTRELADQFAARNLAALDATDASLILERFYTQVNALSENNADYRNLRDRDYLAVAQLDAFRAEVHAAAAACFARDAEGCNLLADQAVQALLRSGRTPALVAAAAEFHEQHDRFWHNFYNSAAYLALENEAKANLQAPLSTAEANLNAARRTYDQAVAAIPQVRSVRAAEQELYSELCQPAATLNSLPVGDATDELCQRLDRMAELAQQLNSATVTTANQRHQVFLPLLQR